MKKYLLILLSAIFILAACGTPEDEEVKPDSEDEEVKSDSENNYKNIKVHENIGDEIAEESYEVMNTIESYVNDDTEVDYDILDGYLDKYRELWHHEDESLKLTEEEAELFKKTNVLIRLLEDDIVAINFESLKKSFIEVMENGYS